MNHHLLKLDMTYTDLDNGVVILLIILLVHLVLLLIFGLVERHENKNPMTPLYVVTYVIYSILNEILTLFICVGLLLLLGNVGGIIFMILCVVLFCIGLFGFIVKDDIFIFGAGKLPDWISDNYYAKQSYYTKLNDAYKQFKQYNEEII